MADLRVIELDKIFRDIGIKHAEGRVHDDEKLVRLGAQKFKRSVLGRWGTNITKDLDGMAALLVEHGVLNDQAEAKEIVPYLPGRGVPYGKMGYLGFEMHRAEGRKRYYVLRADPISGSSR